MPITSRSVACLQGFDCGRDKQQNRKVSTMSDVTESTAGNQSAELAAHRLQGEEGTELIRLFKRVRQKMHNCIGREKNEKEPLATRLQNLHRGDAYADVVVLMERTLRDLGVPVPPDEGR
jgi:hypothetical protein